MNTCSVSGCHDRTSARGMCNRHYQKTLRYGTPEAGRTFARRGTGTTSKSTGYRLITLEGVQVLEHVAIAEKALGKPLPRGAQVHHVNGSKTDNRPENLVICPGEAYHKLLHRRQEALEVVGDPDKRRCRYCGGWDSKENLYAPPNKDTGFHRDCRQVRRTDQ